MNCTVHYRPLIEGMARERDFDACAATGRFLQYPHDSARQPVSRPNKERAMARRVATLLQLAGALSLSLFVGGCSTTETVSDILSSTTPGDWYTRDGLPKAEHKVDLFLATNLNNVLTDVAKGNGEYLDSLGRLLQVDPISQSLFAGRLQEQYPFLANTDRTIVGKAAMALSQTVR
jgi:Protein of unknown function (DUF3015)